MLAWIFRTAECRKCEHLSPFGELVWACLGLFRPSGPATGSGMAVVQPETLGKVATCTLRTKHPQNGRVWLKLRTRGFAIRELLGSSGKPDFVSSGFSRYIRTDTWNTEPSDPSTVLAPSTPHDKVAGFPLIFGSATCFGWFRIFKNLLQKLNTPQPVSQPTPERQESNKPKFMLGLSYFGVGRCRDGLCGLAVQNLAFDGRLVEGRRLGFVLTQGNPLPPNAACK